MKFSRRQLLHFAAGAALLTLNADYSLGQAQNWPVRPVTMIVPTAAGGGSDILSRIFAGRLSEILGQPVIVENVGNSVAATARVAKGIPDGYHFVLGALATIAFHPTMYKTPVYNPLTDFAPVAMVVEQPFLLVTRIDFPREGEPREASVRLRGRDRFRKSSVLRTIECGHRSEGHPCALSGCRTFDSGHVSRSD
jgi:tripartite-type tricarboxylate transporter receptor subunit TctC